MTSRLRLPRGRALAVVLAVFALVVASVGVLLGRSADRLASVRTEVGPYVKTLDYAWNDYRLDFQVVAMMQTITGRIEVYDDFVRIDLELPRLLHLLAKTIQGRIENRAAALLEGPKPKT